MQNFDRTFRGRYLLADRGRGLGVRLVLKHLKVRLNLVLWIRLTPILVNTVAEIPLS
jgi:hypothetical protein